MAAPVAALSTAAQALSMCIVVRHFSLSSRALFSLHGVQTPIQKRLWPLLLLLLLYDTTPAGAL